MTQTLSITLSDKNQAILKQEADKNKMSLQEYVSNAINLVTERNSEPQIEMASSAEFRMAAAIVNSKYSQVLENLAGR